MANGQAWKDHSVSRSLGFESQVLASLGKPSDLSQPPFASLENPLHPAQEASPGGALPNSVVSELPLSQGFTRGKAATLL